MRSELTPDEISWLAVELAEDSKEFFTTIKGRPRNECFICSTPMVSSEMIHFELEIGRINPDCVKVFDQNGVKFLTSVRLSYNLELFELDSKGQRRFIFWFDRNNPEESVKNLIKINKRVLFTPSLSMRKFTREVQTTIKLSNYVWEYKHPNISADNYKTDILGLL